MEHPSAVVSRYYTQAFVLDRPKLTRLHEILVQRFTELGQGIGTRFNILFSAGKAVELTTIEKVFELDNTVKDPIRVLAMRISAGNETTSTSCEIEFDNDLERNIHLTVRGQENRWANQVFDEMDERIGRTFTDSWVYFFKSGTGHFVMLFTFLVVVALSLLLYGTINFRELKALFFDPNAAEILTTKGEAATTLEEKVDFLVESQLLFTRKFKRTFDTPTSIATIANWRTAAITLPIVIVILALIYLALRCYPRAVFLWGDWEDRFATLLERRRFVWNAIIVGLVIEVIAFFFGLGLSS